MKLVQIIFQLQVEDGYPPVQRERLWGIPQSGLNYQIDSVPFFVQNISLGDIVKVSRRGKNLHFSNIIAASGNTTVRLVVDDIDIIPATRVELHKFGCVSEYYDSLGLVTVNIPEPIEYSIILSYLREGETRGAWDFEESSLRHE